MIRRTGFRPLPSMVFVLLLLGAAPMVLVAAAVEDARAAGSRPPNFVIILADDMGYGDASCYGNERYQTPHLDRLAAEGMRFTDFHSNGTVCSPTRAALVTGRYQQRAGIPGVIFANPKRNRRHHGLQRHEVTFATRLKDAGYATGLFGKWHLGYQKKYNPIHHGFDRFRGFVSGNVDYISHLDQTGIHDWWDGDKKIEEEGYTTHLITRHAVRFIEEQKDRPFCLYVPHEAPHYPYQGPEDEPVRQAGGEVHIHAAERTDIPAAYEEMMVEMDQSIGEVVATLKRLDLAENTLVFFFSDNGANRNGSNAPFRGFKGSVWEGGHRVPAVAWWPGRIEPGSVCKEPATALDLMPTMLELAGLPLPQDRELDGVSLVSLLTGGESLGERTLFWDYNQRSAVRQGPWKLVTGERDQQAEVGLYNLDEDPAERRNLAQAHPDRVDAMLEALEVWKQDVADGATLQPEM